MRLLYVLAAIPEVVRVLGQHLRNGVGLATRAAAAEAMSSLAERYPHDLGSYASICLEGILSTLLNARHMTSTLKKAMLAALAALAKAMHYIMHYFLSDGITAGGGSRHADEELRLPRL